MAIHPLISGVEVNICVNDQPLPEYEDPDSHPRAITTPTGKTIRTITKYIASVADAEFGISYKIDRSYNLDSPSVGFYTKIDGAKVGSNSMIKPIVHNKNSWSRIRHGNTISGAKGKPDMFYPFKFTKIETSLSDHALRKVEVDKKEMGEVGQIVVDVYRLSADIVVQRPADVQRAGQVTSQQAPKLAIEAGSEVHEKAMKGDPKYHGAGYGTARPGKVSDGPSDTRTYVNKLDGADCPILRFVFKYRSEEGLKQLLIMERTPEPEEARVVPNGVNLDGLNERQRLKVENYVRDLTESGPGNATRGVKRERNNNVEEISSRIKKPRVPAGIELVDLTDD